MAALPQFKRFSVEDFPTEKKWISPLLLTLNTFMEEVTAALDKALTLSENTNSDIKTINLSTAPSTTAPVSVTWSKNTNPSAVIVANVTLSDGTPLTLASAVQVQFQMSGKNLQITNVVGLTFPVTNSYVLTLICIAG